LEPDIFGILILQNWVSCYVFIKKIFPKPKNIWVFVIGFGLGG
jgi:hypothetical protein